jgi:Fe-S-cluster containining protein
VNVILDCFPQLLQHDGQIANPCDHCGVCCLAFPLPPFDAHELVKAPDGLLRELDAYQQSARYRDSHPCFWLDLASGKCKHYDVRPVLCRWFQPGSAACHGLRRSAGLQSLPEHAADCSVSPAAAQR